ncbi:MAG: DUF1127 domain-containing protein [Rubrivivax sp.]|nr:DUF1127 domain-containing protein [Rubrivivax sp.]
MITASSTPLRIPAPPIVLDRPPWSRRWAMFAEAWSAWRSRARQRAELRALATLDPRLLKDVGLGEFAAGSAADAAAWRLVELGRW